jgi:deazaflavin-dependent oxidoreductase (nitroreductase family)
VRTLLRSPLHRIASRDISILHFTGRKSGRARNTPLSYVRDGDTVLFLSSLNTGWWKNFRDGDAPVEVEIGGEREAGTARLLEGDSEELRDGVTRFLTALPRDAAVYGVKLDRARKPRADSLAAAADRLVLVVVTLD